MGLYQGKNWTLITLYHLPFRWKCIKRTSIEASILWYKKGIMLRWGWWHSEIFGKRITKGE